MIKITLTIEGMMCPMCEAHVNKILKAELDGCEIKSNHKKNITTVISQNDVSDEKIRESVLKTGYTLKAIKREIL